MPPHARRPASIGPDRAEVGWPPGKLRRDQTRFFHGWAVVRRSPSQSGSQRERAAGVASEGFDFGVVEGALHRGCDEPVKAEPCE
jgi:hypothetical protein